MKIYTSYYYHVRFFKSNMLPLSTAVWDPKWFHNKPDNKSIYVDKRGIINGARAIMFVPDETCMDLCRGPETCKSGDPDECKFLKNYRKQLDKLKFNKVMDWLKECTKVLDTDEEPIVVLLFHEKPDNPCSERVVVTKWFKDHGVNIKELKYPIEDNY